MNAHALCQPADIVNAARCWRAARDAKVPVQQHLHTMLAPLHRGMLAPVFDSLLTLCEAALGHPITVGKSRLSADESLLVGLMDGSVSRACIDCSPSMATVLDCAICSTRIMIALGKTPPFEA